MLGISDNSQIQPSLCLAFVIKKSSVVSTFSKCFVVLRQDYFICRIIYQKGGPVRTHGLKKRVDEVKENLYIQAK